MLMGYDRSDGKRRKKWRQRLGGTIAVTGAAGFIGSWVVKGLLDKGYRVRACVRDVNDARKTDFLRNMPGYASRRLTLHSANLDESGCFDEIFAGCHGVCHVSHVSTYDDQNYMRGVCEHIIASVNQSETVNRVVVTSSIAAIISEADLQELVRRPVFYEDRYPDEEPSELLSAGKATLWAKLHWSACSLTPPKPTADGTVFAFALRIMWALSYLPTKKTWGHGSTILK